MLVKKQRKKRGLIFRLQESIAKRKGLALDLEKKLKAAGIETIEKQEQIVPLVKVAPKIPIKINFLQPSPLIRQPVFLTPFNPWRKSLLNFILICLIIAVPLQTFSYYQEYSHNQKVVTQIKLETNLQLQEALGLLNKLNKDSALQTFTSIQKNLSQVKTENNSLLIANETIAKIILILNNTSFNDLDSTQKALKWAELIKEILPRVLIVKNSLKNI